jgi:hypothetical protein
VAKRIRRTNFAPHAIPGAVVDFAVEFAKGAKNSAKLPVKNFH